MTLLAALTYLPWLVAAAGGAVALWQRLAAAEALRGEDLAHDAADKAAIALAAEEEKVTALRARAAADRVAFDVAQHRIAELEAKLLERAQPGDGQEALASGFGERK